jgi:rubrerythrin
MVKYILILSLCLMGCNTQAVNDNAKAIAVAAVTSVVVKKAENTPDVGVECDGSGYIIHGDGHKTKCPGCKSVKTTVSVVMANVNARHVKFLLM